MKSAVLISIAAAYLLGRAVGVRLVDIAVVIAVALMLAAERSPR